MGFDVLRYFTSVLEEIVYHKLRKHFPRDCNFEHLPVAKSRASREVKKLFMQEKFIVVIFVFLMYRVTYSCSEENIRNHSIVISFLIVI